jgi:hypothetical protein
MVAQARKDAVKRAKKWCMEENLYGEEDCVFKVKIVYRIISK